MIYPLHLCLSVNPKNISFVPFLTRFQSDARYKVWDKKSMVKWLLHPSPHIIFTLYISELCCRQDNIVLLTNLPKIISIIQLGFFQFRDKTECTETSDFKENWTFFFLIFQVRSNLNLSIINWYFYQYFSRKSSVDLLQCSLKGNSLLPKRRAILKGF